MKIKFLVLICIVAISCKKDLSVQTPTSTSVYDNTKILRSIELNKLVGNYFGKIHAIGNGAALPKDTTYYDTINFKLISGSANKMDCNNVAMTFVSKDSLNGIYKFEYQDGYPHTSGLYTFIMKSDSVTGSDYNGGLGGGFTTIFSGKK